MCNHFCWTECDAFLVRNIRPSWKNAGRNGCGKTSILEAIYILTRGKSFRATDPDIIKRGKNFYRVEIEFMNGNKNVVTFPNLFQHDILKR